MTFYQHLIQEYCRRMQIFNAGQLATRLSVPRSTASHVWNAKHPPRGKALREKLYKATAHPAFLGPMTNANKRELLATYTPTTDVRDQVQRTAYLLLAVRIDLANLLTAESPAVRDALRRELALATQDPDAIGTITMSMRALQSERTLQTLRAEGQLEGGGHDHSR